MGLFGWLSIAPWLLWMAVLAVMLMTARYAEPVGAVTRLVPRRLGADRRDDEVDVLAAVLIDSSLRGAGAHEGPCGGDP
jgi:hypothetical protein